MVPGTVRPPDVEGVVPLLQASFRVGRPSSHAPQLPQASLAISPGHQDPSFPDSFPLTLALSWTTPLPTTNALSVRVSQGCRFAGNREGGQ